MAKDEIDIKETEDFNSVKTFLNDASKSVNESEKRLNKIRDGINNNEVLAIYNTKSSSVKKSIKILQADIKDAINHIDKSLSVYALADDNLKKSLDEIYDAIYHDDDEEYERKIMYYANGEDKKLTYEDFVNLVNNSKEYFNAQKEKVYNNFLLKLVTAKPSIIKKLGTSIYNSMVENIYYFSSDDKIGSNKYNDGLIKFKNKFGNEIIKKYDNLDFIPGAYLTDNQSSYEKALLALSFDNKDYYQKFDILMDTYKNISDKPNNISNYESNIKSMLDIFYQAKDLMDDIPNNASPKEILKYYSDELNNLKEIYNMKKSYNEGYYAIHDSLYSHDLNAWYETIKNTEAFKKIKDYLSDDKKDIFDATNSMEFLSAVYQYDGMDALQKLYSDYISKCLGEEVSKTYIKNSDLDQIIEYTTLNNVLNVLYQPVIETQQQIKTIDDSEETSFLLFAQNLDVSDLNDNDYIKALKNINKKWGSYCNGADHNKYLEDWQVKAYAKLLNYDETLAKKLFNMSEGADRGILDEKIMEGYAFDVAKNRVAEMSGNNIDNQAEILKYAQSLIFSAAYGFGYGITDFTTGISDVFNSDGKADRRQMEKANILSLLSGDYTLESQYYNNDPAVMEMFSSNYSTEYINSIKIKNCSREDIDEFINDCRNNKVPRYEIDYYLGNISYDEYLKYKNVNNLNSEDLRYYAKLKNNEIVKGFADKTFKVSNSVGTMAIPTALSILATATGPAGGAAVSALSTGISTTSSLLSYGLMFASTLGRTKEELMANGETNEGLIWTNAILHASLESLGEMALGKVLKPTKLTGILKDATAKNHPFLGALFNASDNLEAYLLKNNCNKKLAKYLSNIAGEVIQENVENIVGHGIDAATYGLFKGEVKLPTLKEMLAETWETTWMTALTTPILNGLTDLSLSNVDRVININGKNVCLSLSDLLLFTNENTNEIDYDSLSKYLAYKGKSEIPYVNAGSDQSIDINFPFNDTDYTNFSVLNEKGDGVINFTRDELLKVIKSLDNEEGRQQLEKLHQLLRNNKEMGIQNTQDLTTFAGYNLLELSNAIDNLHYNIGDYLTYTNVINSFGAILSDLGGKEQYINNLNNLSDEQITKILNSSLTDNDRYNIMRQLSTTTRGKRILLENQCLDIPSIEYISEGKKITINGNDFFNYLMNADFDYKNVDKVVGNGLTQGDLANILVYLDENHTFDFNNTNLADGLPNYDMKQLKLVQKLANATNDEKKFIIWSYETLPQILASNPYISQSSIDELVGKFSYYSQKNWNKKLKEKGYTFFERMLVDGFHEIVTGENNMQLHSSKAQVMGTTLHEANHGCGYLNDHGGLNESLTEYYRIQMAEQNGLKRGEKSYASGVNGVKKLFNSNIPGLTSDDFAKVYYQTHDETEIAKTINGIMGENYYEDVFKKSFDRILVSHGNVDKSIPQISKVVNDIIYEYYNSQGIN